MERIERLPHMITILMATYNGEKYIRQQLDSLLRQTEQGFKVIVSDDGSTDATLDILSEYAPRFRNGMSVIKNAPPHGAKYNFIKLMIEHKDDYLMLCDQDDVWLDTKVERSLRAMHELENRYGCSMPLLVHSDMSIVDANLKMISESYVDMANADYSRTELKDQIIQNTLTGCTAMYNRSLADLITSVPPYFVMHDWWLIITASAFGKVHALKESTILYRQHKTNEMGIRHIKSPAYIIRLLYSNADSIKNAIKETYKQAESFLGVFYEKLNDKQKSFLLNYIAIPRYNKIRRINEVRRLGVWKTSFVRRAAQLFFL